MTYFHICKIVKLSYSGTILLNVSATELLFWTLLTLISLASGGVIIGGGGGVGGILLQFGHYKNDTFGPYFDKVAVV